MKQKKEDVGVFRVWLVHQPEPLWGQIDVEAAGLEEAKRIALQSSEDVEWSPGSETSDPLIHDVRRLDENGEIDDEWTLQQARRMGYSV